MHRRRPLSRAHTLLAGALLIVALVALPITTAHAVTTGSGNWYWPVGTENFHGWDGWWVFRSSNHSWHMAQDMPVAVGHAVYAIGDGTVLESKPDSGYGGVLVILHTAGDGRVFKAVYGHMIRSSGTGVGAKVKAGQIIGHVNSCRHLHFGIHPGRAYPPDNNPFRGHTYTKSNTYGWTDPVAYLRAHPRTLAYKAPALPKMVRIDTEETPTVLGVADGRVFWRTGSEEASPWFSRALAGGEVVRSEPDAPVPALDADTFPSLVSTSSFVLLDPRTTVAARPSATVVAWKHPVVMGGRVTNAAGLPFIGARVVVETSSDGTTWTAVARATTGLTGSFTGSFVPSRRVAVRVTFAPPSTFRVGSSAVTTVAPRPCVSTPAVPSLAEPGRTFTVKGTISPRHPAGSGAAVLRVQRRIEGAWVDYTSLSTTYSDISGGTLYHAHVRLRAGYWRVRTEIPEDTAHAAATSGWRAFTLR